MFTSVLIFVPLGTIFTLISSTTATVLLTGEKLNFANESFIGPSTRMNVGKVIPTFNILPLHFEVLQDFPMDTELKTMVQMFDIHNRPSQLGYYTVKICDKSDPLHRYLPPFLLQLTANGGCVKKGIYDFYDAGQFQFYNLEPKEKFKNAARFVAYNQLLAPGILIKDLELFSVNIWNIL